MKIGGWELEIGVDRFLYRFMSARPRRTLAAAEEPLPDGPLRRDIGINAQRVAMPDALEHVGQRCASTSLGDLEEEGAGEEGALPASRCPWPDLCGIGPVQPFVHEVRAFGDLWRHHALGVRKGIGRHRRWRGRLTLGITAAAALGNTDGKDGPIVDSTSRRLMYSEIGDSDTWKAPSARRLHAAAGHDAGMSLVLRRMPRGPDERVRRECDNFTLRTGRGAWHGAHGRPRGSWPRPRLLD
jgi:hypothetical protein